MFVTDPWLPPLLQCLLWKLGKTKGFFLKKYFFWERHLTVSAILNQVSIDAPWLFSYQCPGSWRSWYNMAEAGLCHDKYLFFQCPDFKLTLFRVDWPCCVSWMSDHHIKHLLMELSCVLTLLLVIPTLHFLCWQSKSWRQPLGCQPNRNPVPSLLFKGLS